MREKRTSAILGADGEPLQVELLTEEISEAQLTGMRSTWSHESIASYLSPSLLSDVLTRAADGDHHDFLTLAEEMEERDLHYSGVLGGRKRALSGIQPEVIPVSDSAQDVRIAEEVRQIIEMESFADLVDGCLDGLGKGYGAVESIWETSSSQWHYKQFKWRDPRFFNLDRDNGTKLLLISDENPMGKPLPAYKFTVHKPRLKMGLPIRGALARLAAVSYLCKGVALSDWMTFAELFGMPVRLGMYGRGATPEEKSTLRNAVANIGSDAAAIIPESMRIEFIETAKAAGGDRVFEVLCVFLDKQVSKGILGQTMTTDDGSSQAQATVHNDVRGDILASDIRQLEATLKRDIVIPFVMLNHGQQEKYPVIKFPIVEPEDLNALTAVVKELVPLGFRVPTQVMHEKTGIREPEKDEEVLVPTQSSTVIEPDENHKSDNLALNREARPDDLSLFNDEMDEWKEQLNPIVTPIEELVNASKSYEELKERLTNLLGSMDSSSLVTHLASALFKARGQGDTD
jgi:phage gp29-like protein